ncbi:MAG: CBS domain-containing protein, partial [Pseudomonadota bacterium]
MTVKAILREKGSKVFTMTPTATLAEVAKELSERRIGAVLVMDGETLHGIISERDICQRCGGGHCEDFASLLP